MTTLDTITSSTRFHILTRSLQKQPMVLGAADARAFLKMVKMMKMIKMDPAKPASYLPPLASPW